MTMQPIEMRKNDPAYRIQPENIPEDLKAGRVWLCWVLEKRDNKPTKVPYVPSPAGLTHRASSTDPQTWRSFDEALACAQKHHCGIGRVFVGDGINGIDYDAKPELSDTAKGLVEMTHSYTELSPSGKGMHTFIRAEAPEWFKGARRGDIEVYRKDRYFTVTGNRVNGHAHVLVDQPLMDAVLAVVKPIGKSYQDTDLPISPENPPDSFRDTLPPSVLACLNGFDSLTGNPSTDDFAVAKELLRIHPDAGWVMEVLREGDIRQDKEKYDRPSYWVPTIKRAWASLLAGFDVEEVEPEPKSGEHIQASEFVSLYDLMNGPEPDPIAFSIAQMQTTGLHIFGAAPKTGKTRFMLQASMAISVGALLMGRFPTIKQKVLYYMLEDGLASLRNRLKAMNLPMPGPEDFVIKFTAPQGWAALRADIKATGATYVVIDTAAMFEMGDEGKVNAYEQDKKRYRPLKVICDELGITIVVITHTTKATNEDNPFAEIQGSLGKQGMASGMMVMRRVPRDKSRVMLHVHGRDINMEAWMLQPVGDTPAWEVADEATAVGGDAAQEILNCLRTHGESRAGEIADITGLTRQWVHGRLNKMLEAGLVTVERHRYRATNIERVVDAEGEIEW